MGERERGREGRKENRVEKKGKKVGGGGMKKEKRSKQACLSTLLHHKNLL